MSERTRDGLEAARARDRTGGQNPVRTPRQARIAQEMCDEFGADGRRAYTVPTISSGSCSTLSRGMDLEAFTGVYRRDGQGRPAHDPAMMVALLVYAYSRGQRSSRGIERACIEDIAFRVVAANRVPDHT